jgi:hypothetical protein
MRDKISRRSMIKRSAGVAVGTVGGAALIDGMIASSAHAGTPGSSRLARVINHTGDTADVEVLSPDTGAVIGERTAPVHGFPDGWRLAKGDKVVLTGPSFEDEPSTIMPLVKRTVGTLAGTARARRAGALTVGKTKMRTQVATFWAGGAGNSRYEAYYIENDLSHSPWCVAVRQTTT